MFIVAKVTPKKKNERVRFHLLPEYGAGNVKITNKFGIEESVDRRLIWDRVLKLQNVKNLSKNARVCSLHFKENDYNYPGKYDFYS